MIRRARHDSRSRLPVLQVPSGVARRCFGEISGIMPDFILTFALLLWFLLSFRHLGALREANYGSCPETR